MEKDIIKQIILNQQEFISQVKLLPRKISIEENGNYVFVGIRRAGKTYMLYQHILQLLKDGHSKQEILFINFEDERITDIKKEELHLIVECYKEMFAFEPIIFLDEMQNIEGWEHFARRLADEKRQVFITGSVTSTMEAYPKVSVTQTSAPGSPPYIKKYSIRTLSLETT